MSKNRNLNPTFSPIVRLQLTHEDEGLLFFLLMRERNWTVKQVAEFVNLSISTVRRRLKLVKINE